MRPSVVVTRGAPDDAELAALLTVLAALREEPAPPRPERTPAHWAPGDRAYRPPGMWSSG